MGNSQGIVYVQITVSAFFHDKSVGETDKGFECLACISAIECAMKKAKSS